jgi:hypothetical protein
MGLFDWLRPSAKPAQAPGELSRRDFFARVAGRPAPPPPQPPPPKYAGGIVHSFHVAGFPYHDGPVLVPTLKPGMPLELAREPDHPTNPLAIRILLGKDHLGYVPPALSAEIADRLTRGERMLCRTVRVNPSAELARVLTVEIAPGEKPTLPPPG